MIIKRCRVTHLNDTISLLVMTDCYTCCICKKTIEMDIVPYIINNNQQKYKFKCEFLKVCNSLFVLLNRLDLDSEQFRYGKLNISNKTEQIWYHENVGHQLKCIIKNLLFTTSLIHTYILLIRTIGRTQTMRLILSQ